MGNKVVDGGVALILAREVLGQRSTDERWGPGGDWQFI